MFGCKRSLTVQQAKLLVAIYRENKAQQFPELGVSIREHWDRRAIKRLANRGFCTRLGYKWHGDAHTTYDHVGMTLTGVYLAVEVIHRRVFHLFDEAIHYWDLYDKETTWENTYDAWASSLNARRLFWDRVNDLTVEIIQLNGWRSCGDNIRRVRDVFIATYRESGVMPQGYLQQLPHSDVYDLLVRGAQCDAEKDKAFRNGNEALHEEWTERLMDLSNQVTSIQNRHPSGYWQTAHQVGYTRFPVFRMAERAATADW